MFKFGGWKASLKLGSLSRHREVYENGPEISVGGAYRMHREEFLGRDKLLEPPKKLTPSMVKLPPSKEALKSSKSANDLNNTSNLPPQLRKSTPDVSTDPRGGALNNKDSSRNTKSKSTSKDARKESKKQDKEQKEAEKKQLAEQKKREKLAKQEQAKQDKLKIQRDRQIAQQQAKDVKTRKEQGKSKKKDAAPQRPLPQASVAKSTLPPTSVPQAPIPPTPQPPQRSNPLGQPTQYSTNTLESSISRSSGPPPYTETPKPPEKQPNKKDMTGNTSFSKPIENSSWDLISEHRNQMSRNPVAGGFNNKQMVMDLQFSFDKAQNSGDRNNSEV